MFRVIKFFISLYVNLRNTFYLLDGYNCCVRICFTIIKLLHCANVIINMVKSYSSQNDDRLEYQSTKINQKMSARLSYKSSKENKYNLLKILTFILTIFRYIDIANAKGDQGAIDSENKYPFVVVLEKRPIEYHNFEIKRKCSGSLIDDNWIITSAHCLDDNIKAIRYGNMTQNTNKTTANILLKIQHPLYRNVATKFYYHSENDIALIKVDKIPIGLAKIDPIHFSNLTHNDVVYADFEKPYIASGFSEDVNKTIQVLSGFENSDLKVYKGVITDCKRERTHIWYDAICVKTKRTPIEILRESSGGPLLLNGKIIGVNAGLLYDNVVRFAPISSYLGWIHEVITNDS